MIITCGQCQTKFKVNSSLIRETGTRVRCSNCQAVFTVFAPKPEEIAPAGREGLEDLDRELESMFQGQDQGDAPVGGQPRLAARPPRRAENNPINLIKGNGDSFVVPDGTMALRPPDPGLDQGPEADLGLGADPVSQDDLGLGGPGEDPAGGPPPGQDGPWTAEGPPATPPPLRNRPGPVFSKNQKTLLLVLSVAAAALVISSLYLSLGSGPGQEAAPAPRAPAAPQGQETAGEDLAAAQDDGASRILLSFLPNSTHHYLENREAGRLLVITGQIQNDDDRPISFIRVKAKLVDGQDKILAERQVFAGNLLNEEELTALPMKDILSRLSLRGGQNGLNTNLAPSKSIPYMLVFDRLPAEAASYSVEPVSYSEASAANPG